MVEKLAHLSNTGHGLVHLVYEYLMIFTVPGSKWTQCMNKNISGYEMSPRELRNIFASFMIFSRKVHVCGGAVINFWNTCENYTYLLELKWYHPAFSGRERKTDQSFVDFNSSKQNVKGNLSVGSGHQTCTKGPLVAKLRGSAHLA